MEAIYIIATIIIFGTGVAVGLYVSSQIEKSIDRNINRNKKK